MTSHAETWESRVLRDLQLTSEAQGLKFYINPPPEVIPGFLGDFRPDAIARGPEGGIVIELKRRQSPGTEKQLAEVARRVSSQKGWEFRAIFLNPPDEPAPVLVKPTQRQLHAAFEEVEALTRGGHHAAALVTAWATLESLARLASSHDETQAPRIPSPLQVVQTLAEEGYLENEAAGRLRDLAKLRNAVVHGDFSVDVPAPLVEGLLDELRSIASNIENAA